MVSLQGKLELLVRAGYGGRIQFTPYASSCYQAQVKGKDKARPKERIVQEAGSFVLPKRFG